MVEDRLSPSIHCQAGASDRLKSDPAIASLDEGTISLSLEVGGVGSFDWNIITGEGSASRGCYSIFGYGLTVVPSYSNFLRVVLPEDLQAVQDEIQTSLREQRQFRSEFRIVRPIDGRVRWVKVDGGILSDDHPRAARMIGIVRDVTERRQAQDRENLLAREVDHRAKNLLTVVQSLVQLTRADDIDGFRTAVNGRIQALGRAHSLLASSRWEGADLSLLIDEELAPFIAISERLHVEGPPVKLRPAAAQSMALVLHELITNAVKYGALSNEDGSVRLNWQLNAEDDHRLHIRWCESGGPPVRTPARKGFGTTVMSASVERQLGGTLQCDWRVEGLCCDLSLPSKELVASGETPVFRQAPPQHQILAGRAHAPISILLVEDEPLIAMQVAQLLSEQGSDVVGPAASVGEALELISATYFDAALLDVDLNGARSFPIADLLREQGRPFAFLSSFGVSDLPSRFQQSSLLAKPLCAKELSAFIAEATDQPSAALDPCAAAIQGTLF